jgi:hypothetical protein
VLFPIIVTELVYRYVVESRSVYLNRSIRALIWLGLFLVPAVLMSLIHPNFSPGYFLQMVVENHDAFVQLSAPDDLIRYQDLSPTVWSFLKNSPIALVSGMYRPLVWEAENMTQLVAGFENMVIMILSITAILSIRNHKHALPGRFGVLILMYVVILCVFLSFSSPNFGTLSRYRVGFLPFLLLLLTYNNVLIDYIMLVLTRLKNRLVP